MTINVKSISLLDATTGTISNWKGEFKMEQPNELQVRILAVVNLLDTISVNGVENCRKLVSCALELQKISEALATKKEAE